MSGVHEHETSDASWRVLSDLFQEWTGTRLISTERDAALRWLTQAAQQAGLDVSEYLSRTQTDDKLRQDLIDSVATGATWFMRDEAGLRTLVQALARSTGKDKTLWLWSAGCATGEEAYSLAMAVADEGIRARVLGTDVNQRAIEHAQRGVYSPQRLRHVPKSWLWRYFDQQGKEYRVKTDIRRAVSFEWHNVKDGPYPPTGWFRFDALVCRNVLFYFAKDLVLPTIYAMTAACRPKGYLLLGASERSIFWVNELAERDAATELVQVFHRAQGSDERPLFRPVVALHKHVPRPRSGQWAGARVPDDMAGADAVALLDRADSARRGGELELSLALIDAAINKQPRLAAAYLARGLLLKQANRVHEAIEALRASRFLDSDTWLAPYQLALCLETVGIPEDARESYAHTLGVLENKGLSGLHRPSADVDILGETTAEVCRERMNASEF